ncbi:MAG TPA: GGDEF domain-containing protein [Spongiibacteraceae bacterium]|nr:GGDEF domain-containing protein [Spongiibacteraceae bacterium]
MPTRPSSPEDITTAYKSLVAILDGLDALVYVSDMQTYELIFINKYGRERWGPAQGRRCYEVLQAERRSPCDFCTNRHLLDARGAPREVYRWDFQNTVNQRWYRCHDQAITWVDGRVVRLEIATDITDRVLMEEALKAAKQHADALARTDQLTAIPNRRAVFEEGCRAVTMARRFANPLAVVLMDVDRFKSINDRFGHSAGDRALQLLARLVADNIRSVDIFGRIGGEEFALILPQTSGMAAVTMAEKLRSRIASTAFALGGVDDSRDGEAVAITCSFGVAELQTRHNDFEALVSNADKALYRAKAQGRNCVRLD